MWSVVVSVLVTWSWFDLCSYFRSELEPAMKMRVTEAYDLLISYESLVVVVVVVTVAQQLFFDAKKSEGLMEGKTKSFASQLLRR